MTKTKKIPIIRGINPQKGKIIALHNHPKAIMSSLDALVKEAGEDMMLKNLFEDISVLTAWALARLPLVPPPTEEKPSAEEKAPTED